MDVNIQKEDGYTALMYAIGKNQPEIAKQILDKDGIDVNLQNNGNGTALIVAIAQTNQTSQSKFLTETMYMSIFKI